MRHFSKEHIKTSVNAKRAELQITFIGLFVNVVLMAMKLVGGVLGHSRALIADGVHSFADFLTDIITSLGIYLGNIPEDECHHYGHKKIETVAEIIMGFILICVGALLTFNAGRAIYYNDVTEPHRIAIVIALFSFVIKEILFHITVSVGKHSSNTIVIANAWHHRSDALSSLAVLLGLIAIYFFPALRLIDAFLGFVVGALIIGIGWRISWDALKRIVDTKPSDEYYTLVESVLKNSNMVKHYHKLRMRYIGNEIFVEFHIEVAPDMSIYEGHEVARALKKEIMERGESMYDVLIHIEPEGDHLKSKDA